MAWTNDTHYPARAPTGAMRGVPSLHYPFKEALRAALEEEPSLHEAFEEGATLLHASYFPNLFEKGQDDATTQTLGDVQGRVDPASAPHAEPVWRFGLLDAAGLLHEVETSRTVDRHGETIGQWVQVLRRHVGPDVAPPRPDDPWIQELLRALDQTLLDLRLDAASWEHQRHAYLAYHRDDPRGSLVLVSAERPQSVHVQARQATDGGLVGTTDSRNAEGMQEGLARTPQARPASEAVPRIVALPDDALETAVKGGAAFGFALLLVYFWDIIKALLAKVLFLPLYAKLRKERLLDHATRDEILTYLRANPGAHKSELRKVLGIGLGTASHHLDVLERNALVTSVRSGRTRCYFAKDAAGCGSERALHAVLSADATRRVYRHILSTPGVRQRALAETLGVSQTAVIFHVRKLIAVGAVEKARAGREVLYRPVPR